MTSASTPGAKVPLDELYEQYGVKHNIREGEDFVQWLRNVKLKDTNRWKITLEEEDEQGTEVVDTEEVKRESGVSSLVPTKMRVEDVVNLSVRIGREVLPKVTDLKLLKYALQEANQLSGKDSLCRIIRKRIRDLQIAR